MLFNCKKVMNKKTYTKIGDKYYPNSNGIIIRVNEVLGGNWRAWEEENAFFFEHDIGHFASKFEVVEISKIDYQLLREGKIDDISLVRKYGADYK